MGGKNLLLATATLAVLGGLVYWSTKSKEKEDGKPAADAAPKVLSLTEADITKIDIRRAEGEQTTLVKDSGGGWTLLSPASFATEKEAVNSLVSAVAAVTSEKLVEEKPADTAPFGLAQPRVEITVTLKDGKSKVLRLGDDVPVGGGVFAQVQGDARVFSLSSITRTALDKKAADLRDKRLLTFNAEKLTRVELGPTEFNKNAQGDWAIVKPKPVRADNWQVEELIRQLREAKLDTSLTDEQRKDLMTQFAAAAPVAVAKVTDASGTQTFEVRKNKDGKYYAKSSAIEGAYLLEGDAGKAFEKKTDDFRSKKLFDFGFNDPTKVEYKDSSRQLTLAKGGEQWTSGGKKMDSIGVQSLIDKLRELSATKFPESGFTTPTIEISVTAKSAEKVLISKSGEKYLGKREGEPGLYELDSKYVVELVKIAGDVKEQPAPPPQGAAKK